MLSHGLSLVIAILPILTITGCGSPDDDSTTLDQPADTEPTSGIGDAPALPAGVPPSGQEVKPTPEPSTETTPPDQDCYEADEFICAIEHAIIQQTNALRSGRQAFVYSRRITYASRQWSQAQGQRGRIGHDGFTSQRYQVIRNHFGDTSGVGLSAENVAYSGGLSGADAERIARQFTNMWWNSSGHRRNMLGNYSHIGVGVYQRSNGSYYATQIFGSDSN